MKYTTTHVKPYTVSPLPWGYFLIGPPLKVLVSNSLLCYRTQYYPQYPWFPLPPQFVLMVVPVFWSYPCSRRIPVPTTEVVLSYSRSSFSNSPLPLPDLSSETPVYLTSTTDSGGHSSLYVSGPPVGSRKDSLLPHLTASLSSRPVVPVPSVLLLSKLYFFPGKQRFPTSSLWLSGVLRRFLKPRFFIPENLLRFFRYSTGCYC